MAENPIKIVIETDSAGAIRNIKAVNAPLKQLGSNTQQVARKGEALSAMASRQQQSLVSLGSAARHAAQGVGLLTAGVFAKGLKDGIQFNATMESNALALRNLTGSTDKANQLLQDLWQTAKETPFEFTDVAGAAKKFLAFGFSIGQTKRALDSIGNAVAAMGGGADMINRVTIALGQMQAKGKVYSEELLQLTEAGIPAQRILREELGMTADDIANIGKLNVSSQKAIDALIRGMNKRFGGMARDQSTTFQGLTSTMKDSWAQMTGAMTKSLFKEAKKWAPKINEAANEITAIWERDKLSFDQKVDLSEGVLRRKLGPLAKEIKAAIDDANLPKRLANAFSAAVPLIAESAGRTALLAAQAFGKGFTNADVLGKAVMGAWLMHKLGGFAYLRQVGKRSGMQVGAGMAEGITTGTAAGVGAGAAGGGLAAGLRGKLKSMAPMLKAAGKMYLGANLAIGLAEGIQEKGIANKIDATVQNTASNLTFGAVDSYGEKKQKELNKQLEQYEKWKKRIAVADKVYLAQVPSAIAFQNKYKFMTDKQTAALKKLTAARLADIKQTEEAAKGTDIGLKLGGNLRKEQKVTRKVLNDIIDDLNDLSPAARKAGSQSVIGMAAMMERQGKLPKGSARKIYKEVTYEFGKMRGVSIKESQKMVSGMVKNFENLTGVVQAGMSLIGGDVNSAMEALGLNKINFGTRKGQEKGANKIGEIAGTLAGLAGGGWIGQPGKAGRDNIPIIVGEGEAVLNRHQQGPVDHALKQTYGIGLPQLFSKINRPHYMASGGIVGLGKQLQGQGYSVGEHPAFGGVAPVHAPNSYHYRGQALDINADSFPGGEMSALDKLSKQLKAKGWHVIWRAPGHYDHLHVDTAFGAQGGVSGGGKTGGMSADIAKITITGEDGPLKDIAQASVDKVQAAAAKKLAESANVDQGEPAPDGGAATAASGSMRQWLTKALKVTNHYSPENLNKLVGRAMQESGGNPKAINNWDVNAKKGTPSKGLLQVIDPTFSTYHLDGYDDIWNPVDNAVAAVRYMYARYGHVVGPGPGGYARGGIVMQQLAGLNNLGGFGMFASGGKASGSKKKSPNAPSKAGKSEHKSNWQSRVKQLKKKVGKNKVDYPGNYEGFYDLSGKLIEQLEEKYDLLEREYGISEEDATKELTLPLSNEDLAALKTQLSSDDYSWVQTMQTAVENKRSSDSSYELTVEVRNEPDISTHVEELENLDAVKEQISGWYSKRSSIGQKMMRHLRKGIQERAEKISLIKQRLRANIIRMREIKKKIDGYQEKISKAKGKKDSKSKVAGWRKEIKTLQAEYSDLSRENRSLSGDTTGTGEEGLLGKLQESTSVWKDEKSELSESLALVPADQEGVRLDRQTLLNEMSEWKGTSPEKATIDEEGSGSSDSSSSTLTDLLKQQLEETQTNLRVSQAQFAALGSIGPLVAGRLVGSFAKGGLIPDTGLAMVHKDELIIPDPEGPYNNQITNTAPVAAAPAEIVVNVSGDVAGLIKTIDARVDGRAAKVVSEQLGRKSRVLAAAPGR